MAENETRTFTISATDPEGDPFIILWRLDGTAVGAGTRFAYYPNYSSEGNHTLAAEVSDGSRMISTGWNITLLDSPSPILSQRPVWRNLTASAGDTVSFGIELRAGPFDIQWFLDGIPVDGANGSAFRLATDPSSVGAHSVAVTINASGHEDRRGWFLEVLSYNAPPYFDRVEPPGDSVLMLSHGRQEFVVSAGDPDGGPLSIQWYLGGAALLNETGLHYVYQDRGGPGRVNVTVVASDGELSAVHTWMVKVNLPPVALFKASRKTVNERSAVAFDASPSFDSDGNITEYRWSFGDGSLHTSNGPAASHSYARPGLYVVELRVTDEAGANSNSTMTIEVRRPQEGARVSGFGGLLALAAAASVAVLEGIQHRRKKAPYQRN
jgi:hypothetical protein